jgi:hypothetical protein
LSFDAFIQNTLLISLSVLTNWSVKGKKFHSLRYVQTTEIMVRDPRHCGARQDGAGPESDKSNFTQCIAFIDLFARAELKRSVDVDKLHGHGGYAELHFNRRAIRQ